MGETMLQIMYIIKVKHFDSRTGSPNSRFYFFFQRKIIHPFFPSLNKLIFKICHGQIRHWDREI